MKHVWIVIAELYGCTTSYTAWDAEYKAEDIADAYRESKFPYVVTVEKKEVR